MKKIIKLRESDINRIVNKVLNETTNNTDLPCLTNNPSLEKHDNGKGGFYFYDKKTAIIYHPAGGRYVNKNTKQSGKFRCNGKNLILDKPDRTFSSLASMLGVKGPTMPTTKPSPTSVNNITKRPNNNTKVPYRVNEDIDPETEMRMVGKMKDSFYNMQSNMGRIGHAIEELVLQKKSFRSDDKEQLETLYRFLNRFSEDTNQATEVLKRFLQEKYY